VDTSQISPYPNATAPSLRSRGEGRTLTNPQSLNLYNYALNNPLAFLDLNGLELVRAVLSNGQSVVVDRSIAGDVMSLVDDAQAAGLRVTITSGFRSVAEQRRLYNLRQAGHFPNPVARPGHSGHNSGQSIDIGTGRMSQAQRNLLAAIARRNGLPYAGAVDPVHFGAGFGVAIDPQLLQENGVDHPYPDSTIVDGGQSVIITVTCEGCQQEVDTQSIDVTDTIPYEPPPPPPPLPVLSPDQSQDDHQ
jgi:hypothetical protein